jgi:hypothetical protein
MNARRKQRMLLKQFFIPESLNKALRDYAALHDVSVSFVIRCSIQSFIDPCLSKPLIQKNLLTFQG